MIFDKIKLKKPSKNDIGFSSQAFIVGLVVGFLQAPIHESGHYIGAWLAGARDMVIQFHSTTSYEIERFPPKRRVMFSLGGPVIDRICFLLGYSFLKSNKFVLKASGLSINFSAVITPVITIFWFKGNTARFYRNITDPTNPKGEISSDETTIAKHLKINPSIVWLLESSFDIYIFLKTLQSLPAPKLITFFSSFAGVYCGSRIFYDRLLGPVLLPPIKQATEQGSLNEGRRRV